MRLEVVDVDHRERERLLRLAASRPHSRSARSKPRRFAISVSGSSFGLLLRLGELRLQRVDALRHLREQHVVAALLLDHRVLELLRLGGDEALQLADVVDVGQRADAIRRPHQVDVEGLGLAGEIGERLAQDLDDRGQFLLALGQHGARVGEVGVAELRTRSTVSATSLVVMPRHQRLAQPLDAGLEVGRARRFGSARQAPRPIRRSDRCLDLLAAIGDWPRRLRVRPSSMGRVVMIASKDSGQHSPRL